MFWLYVAIPAAAAIAISACAGKRAQLVAFAFLLLAVDAVVLLAIQVTSEYDLSSFLRATPAVYVAGFWALVGAVVALVNGLSAGRDARSGLEAGRWVVIGASAALLLTGLLPLRDPLASNYPHLWFLGPMYGGRWWWLAVALPALTAIAVSSCVRKRVQLVASGFLLLALYATIRLAAFDAQFRDFGFLDSLRARPALYVAAVLALVGAVTALINGLSTKRE